MHLVGLRAGGRDLKVQMQMMMMMMMIYPNKRRQIQNYRENCRYTLIRYLTDSRISNQSIKTMHLEIISISE